jgi:hypothetical protein
MWLSDFPLLNLLPGFYCILTYYSIMTVLAYSGSSTTNKAKETLVLVGKLTNQTDDVESKIDLKNILRSLRTRDLAFKTIFFEINWCVLLTVSSNYVFIFSKMIISTHIL